MARCYDQYCPVAHSLDLVGERWALLVVRELLKGPQRYTDLLAGLPGIGTNILAARLRALEEGGVVCKTKLPPPAASTVYELTPYGEELEEVVYALGRWGARTLGPPAEGATIAPGWLQNALRATFEEQAARGVEGAYELRVDDEVAAITIAEGRLRVEPTSPESVDLTIETDASTLFRLVSRELDPAEALADGAVRLSGENKGGAEALETFVSLFSFAPRVPVPAS
jgi:DNA-binding HxlR family transcriptional regulator/putative sterol carrier protein